MTDTNTVTDVETILDTYLATWNEADRERRARLVERAWAPDGRYVDPLQEAHGHPALSTMVDAVQERFPGHVFRRRSGVDVHHDQLRFAWDLAGPDGSVVVTGLDVGQLAADGRLRQITGFFGDLPEGP
jgi:hypothetical protein